VGNSWCHKNTIQLPSSPAQTGLCSGEKEAGDHVSEGGPRETEQLYTEHIPS